jgi:xanthosine utilization system XapX-like protein
MTNERLEELLNKEIDGIATPAEVAELNAYVQAHPDAKQLREDLHRLSAVLRNVEELEPPSGLQSDIMAAVPQGRTGAQSRLSILTWVRDLIETRTKFEYAYAFAAGMIIGIALYSLMEVQTSAPPDTASLAGSILLNNATLSLKDGPGFEIHLTEEEVQAKVSTKHSEGLVIVDVGLSSQRELSLLLQFDEKILRFKGYSQARTIPANITSRGNGLVMTSVGENHYILIFERTTTEALTVGFVLESSGHKLYEEAVQISALSQ